MPDDRLPFDGYHHPDRGDAFNAACRGLWFALTDRLFAWLDGRDRGPKSPSAERAVSDGS